MQTNETHIYYFFASPTKANNWWARVDREVLQTKEGFYWRKIRNYEPAGEPVGPFDSRQEAVDDARGGSYYEVLDARMIG